MKKLYKIPCSWEMYTTLSVEAESLGDAKEIVDNMDLGTLNGSYIENSFQFDEEILEESYPEEIE